MKRIYSQDYKELDKVTMSIQTNRNTCHILRRLQT